MSETRKSDKRRHSNGDFERFFKGKGIDIGSAGDPIKPDADQYDRSLGHIDAQYLQEIEDEKYDYVYSSHCLEHVVDPQIALINWWRVLKTGGHLIVVVPDFGLYEKFQYPSQFNGDHKSTYSIGKENGSFRKDIVKLVQFENAQILRVQVNEENYNYNDRITDQKAQREIEVIVRKWHDPFWCQ